MENMKLYLTLSVCFALAFGSIPNFPQCKRNDPEIEKCILDGIEAMRPRLKDGIPEINVPPLEPFKMDLLYINSSVAGAEVKATVTNIVAHGGSDFNINYLKVDLDEKYVADLEIAFPRLEVTADYNTRGSRMLFFKISGSGKFIGNFTDVVVVVKCAASPFVKDEVEYLQLDSITTKVSIGKAELDVNPTEYSFTGRAASSFISASPSFVLKTFSPVVDETTASVVKQYIDDVLSSVPIKDVLIESR